MTGIKSGSLNDEQATQDKRQLKNRVDYSINDSISFVWKRTYLNN
jgi:hypothetical protein